MNQLYADSIAHVKSLYKDETDVLHDFSHSERDAELARDIAQHVGYKDLDLIELIAIWHDAARATGIDEGHEEASAEMARDDLLGRGVDQITADVVYESIRNHKHQPSPLPSTEEGRIFKDADLLEVASVERFRQAADAGWNDYYISECKLMLENLKSYEPMITYDYTKKLFTKRYQDLKNFVKTIPELN